MTLPADQTPPRRTVAIIGTVIAKENATYLLKRTWRRMMKKLMWGGVALMLVLFSLPAMAEEAVKLDDIVVSGKKLVKPTKQTNETVYTGSEVTKEGIEARGPKPRSAYTRRSTCFRASASKASTRMGWLPSKKTYASAA
jgi:hypothetical protein